MGGCCTGECCTGIVVVKGVPRLTNILEVLLLQCRYILPLEYAFGIKRNKQHFLNFFKKIPKSIKINHPHLTIGC